MMWPGSHTLRTGESSAPMTLIPLRGGFGLKGFVILEPVGMIAVVPKEGLVADHQVCARVNGLCNDLIGGKAGGDNPRQFPLRVLV